MTYNIYENLNFDPEREVEETIFENEKIKIIRTLSLDQTTGYYDQEDLELVKIVEGEAVIEVEGEDIRLKKGDILPINPHEVHRLVYQNHVIWLCIFVKA